MKIWIKKNLWILLLIFAAALLVFTRILVSFAANNALEIENYFSNGLFRILSKKISFIFNSLPFSVAELILMLAIAAGLVLVIALIIFAFKRRWRAILIWLSSLSLIASFLYMQFYLMWGLNYYRMPLSYTIDLPQSARSDEQLFKLCITLSRKANELRASLEENPDGTAYLGELDEILTMPVQAFDNLNDLFNINGSVKRAKPVILSEAMCYANISGIYIPYTFEANVNIKQPTLLLPSTACHEAVHQIGFAREEEANFLAFLACWYSSDIRLQYSGIMLALITAQNAYVKVNPTQAYSIMRQYSKGVERDLSAHNEFWEKYEGEISEKAQKLNDSYLKSNGQTAGVKSYGMMLNLLLDWHYAYLPYC